MFDAASLAEDVQRCRQAGQYAVTISSAAPPAEGRELRAVGNCTMLGDWDVKRAPRLEAVDGKQWEGSYALTVSLPADKPTEFKIVECNKTGGDTRWQVRCHRTSCVLDFPLSDACAQDAALVAQIRGHT